MRSAGSDGGRFGMQRRRRVDDWLRRRIEEFKGVSVRAALPGDKKRDRMGEKRKQLREARAGERKGEQDGGYEHA